jgi:hypothetical protein
LSNSQVYWALDILSFQLHLLLLVMLFSSLLKEHQSAYCNMSSLPNSQTGFSDVVSEWPYPLPLPWMLIHTPKRNLLTLSLFFCYTNALSSANLKYYISSPLFFCLIILNAHWAILFLLCLPVIHIHWYLFLNECRWQANNLCTIFAYFLPLYKCLHMHYSFWSW